MWYGLNKDKRRQYLRAWRRINKTKLTGYNKKQSKKRKEVGYYKTEKYRLHKSLDRVKGERKAYMKKYKKKYRKTEKNMAYERSPQRRISCAIRQRFSKALKRSKRSPLIEELTGLSAELLKRHIDAQFDSNMSWSNYGSYWHIDHIVPCAAFDLSSTEQQKKCFHYSNLRPLEAKENLKKGAKII